MRHLPDHELRLWRVQLAVGGSLKPAVQPWLALEVCIWDYPAWACTSADKLA